MAKTNPSGASARVPAASAAVIAVSLLVSASALPPSAAAAGPAHLAALVASSLLPFPPSASAQHSALEQLDRPQSAVKVNIHAESSDDSSDDEEGCLKKNPDGSCMLYDNVQHFRNDFGELEFKWSSCDDPYGDENHEDFEEVDMDNSLYQRITFEENLKTSDKCLRLDKTLQQCSTYRPHYHEPFVHQSASYLNQGYLAGVRRVVFVGGGDSMLLHEILKYEDVELVLGLELDQKVTRNSFEHFKTQPHFDDPRVQWWFGDGAKSLTLLPRSYFGTFDLVLLDLSETVMSMTVTKGLDVFGAMKLLLSPRGILAKNDFGYFEKLSKVFDTCIQLLIPDVTYICDYELVLCASDEVNFLEPTFTHLKGDREGTVETLVYRPQDDVDDHWGPVTDYSKYWGEPHQCSANGREHSDDDLAYSGVLMIVEAEKVAMKIENPSEVKAAFEEPLAILGYNVILTTATSSKRSKGALIAIVMKEGYILAETWPKEKYVKLDIHLWGNFKKQEWIRTELLRKLGSGEGDWQSYRIVAGGMRGCDTRPDDLMAVGPDLSKIGQCEAPKEGSGRTIFHDSSYDDEEALGSVIDAGMEDITSMMIGGASPSINAVVFCNIEEDPCRAKASLEKQGFENLITLWSCHIDVVREMEESPYKRGEALRRWREDMAREDKREFSLCGKKSDVALRELAKKVKGINLVVVDATAPSGHATGAHEYWLKYWKSIRSPFLLLVPILDARDDFRSFFLRSRYNHAEDEPEYFSEIFLGNEDKTMSFGMIHQGNPESLRRLMRAQVKLEQNDDVTYADIRKVTIRGAMRSQVNYNPVLFSWQDYDQRPGLEQFYDQRPVGLQSVYQLGLDEGVRNLLSAASVRKAAKSAATRTWGREVLEEEFHEVGEGMLFVALSTEGHVVVTWDGAGVVNVNIFTYDERVDHYKKFAAPLTELLPSMSLVLSDEQPRGYNKVINKSSKVNRNEGPDCYDHYRMCTPLKERGNCEGGKGAEEWMAEHCRYSCKYCDGESSYAKSEL